MKPVRMLATALLLSAAAAFAAGQSNSRGFEKMKSLVGEWEGKTSDGQEVKVVYRLVSSGTALMETINAPGDVNMVTMYHPDGERLMMTHYCGANNQPRMVSDGPEGNTLPFSFLDVTNLANPDAGHMHSLKITFDDADHIRQAWTWREKGAEKTEVFHLTRKK
jgi:hypothetical protein